MVLGTLYVLALSKTTFSARFDSGSGSRRLDDPFAIRVRAAKAWLLSRRRRGDDPVQEIPALVRGLSGRNAGAGLGFQGVRFAASLSARGRARRDRRGMDVFSPALGRHRELP